jgi:CHAD domain-containing protein/CYTH domain-containing protein
VDARLLTRAPAQGIRAIGLELLAHARRSLARLERGADEEALHDFRVAVRRLRSTLRAFSEQMRAVGRREHRGLRKLARRTSSSRDAEVQLAWLARERGGIAPHALAGLEWLRERLEGQRRESHGQGSKALARSFERLAGRLERRLEVDAARRQAVRNARFGGALAILLRAHAAELDRRLAALTGPMDVEAGHRARIAAKRLRYLLEPLRKITGADSSEAVATLKRLQDLLGELHDAHVAVDLLKGCLLEVATDRAHGAHAAVQQGAGEREALRAALHDHRTRGLLILDRRAVERAYLAYRGLADEWLPRDRPALADAVIRVVQALESVERRATAGFRRFLLMAVPEEARRVAPLEIDVGWVRGPRLREWVSRVREGESVRFFKGDGVQEDNQPSEVEIDEETFARLWPETEGHRLHKLRYRVLEGDCIWLVDELVDLRRCLLDVPAAGDEAIELPPWLGPLIVRDVTAERAYQDVRLAGRRRRAPAGDMPDLLEDRGGASDPARASVSPAPPDSLGGGHA